MHCHFRAVAFALALPTVLFTLGALAVLSAEPLVSQFTREPAGSSRTHGRTVDARTLSTLLRPANPAALRFLDELRARQRLYAAGFCAPDGTLRNATPRFFPGFSCPVRPGRTRQHSLLHHPSGLSLYVTATPVHTLGRRSTMPEGWLIQMRRRPGLHRRAPASP